MSGGAYDDYFKEQASTAIVTDVDAPAFIKAFAEHLKRQGRFEIPKWADVVKTSKHKDLPPLDPDWLYVRTASMVRKIYIRGGTGVGGFRKVYGGQKRRGVCTNVFSKGSGKIARYVLQQLEEDGPGRAGRERRPKDHEGGPARAGHRGRAGRRGRGGRRRRVGQIAHVTCGGQALSSRRR
ncbi:unnamed protein product [Prorocentrum cordatum]|uniref:40S ribosomal protein S19 n=1 Tax=Prorocentrum cordatum TaxID=2364126 RepID=A0ABN9U3Z2_9DINO|nr:unnamed protein product [Polarella glacialis]